PTTGPPPTPAPAATQTAPAVGPALLQPRPESHWACLSPVRRNGARRVLRGRRRGNAPPLPDWRIWFYLLEAGGLDVQLVNARDIKNAPGRPKTDKLDSVWQAKLTERGMLRPSFVPPAEIRRLRDYTRLRTDLTRERTRYWQRLEKLPGDSLIKVSTVASSLDTLPVRDMLEALIAGVRDPKVLAGLARGQLQANHAARIHALPG